VLASIDGGSMLWAHAAYVVVEVIIVPLTQGGAMRLRRRTKVVDGGG